ncbi:MAG TPA: hypothetical protein VFM18_11490 [Methanosarcina sp.]|nr:hypothetical protein [Methanosarcina sp.]
MRIEFDVDDTSSCAIGMIVGEEWVSARGRPTIKEAAVALQEQLSKYNYSVFLATVVYRNRWPDYFPDYKWWCSVYKKAGFKQFGKTTFNPKSGNMVMKFYFDNIKENPKEVK